MYILCDNVEADNMIVMTTMDMETVENSEATLMACARIINVTAIEIMQSVQIDTNINGMGLASKKVHVK